jgi:putative tryptophan/tyrosine transport system substrate-binding protein
VRLARLTLLVLVLGLLVSPPVVSPQPSDQPRTIGLLWLAPPPASVVAAFREALAERGWVDGRTIRLVQRDAAARPERLPALAAELASMRVAVIVTSGTTAIRAAHDSTSTIPIVFAISIDPVAMGFAKSLSRPGGNVTGLSVIASDLLVKRLELLKEAIPGAKRITVLLHAGNPGNKTLVRALHDAAPGLRVVLQPVEVLDPRDLDAAFDAMKADGAQAVLVLEDPVFAAHAARLAELANRRRIPAIMGNRYFVEAGGLMSYGVIYEDLWRRAAGYTDKILRGAYPGELPIEQPSQYELAINMRTARALRLTIPQSINIRANLVVD